MEKSIEVMKQSINEPRADKKASPLVGAVLLMPDGTVDTAFRGEFRHGDHAEYTLLERKHPGERLDGSVLFATLEPCAPGAGKHPKLACAERIVNARIAEVWVGIEDPDPTVDRQGIRYLEQHGIKVRLFDLDLQEQIRLANKEFIAQAFKRAAEAKDRKAAKPSPLSTWDEVLAGVKLADLASNALARYREQTKILDKTVSAEFMQRLEHQGLLRRRGSKLVPTGFGFLLFAKRPRDVLHHAGLNATIEFPDGTHEIQNFDGPAILIPDFVEDWLRPKLPNVIDRSRMTREERPALPFDLLFPITLEQMQAFTAPMYNRNPKLQFAFSGTKLLEGRGLGMRTLGVAATKYGLPVPKYAFDGVYLNLTIYRHAQAAVRALGSAVLDKLSKSERNGWEWLATKETMTSTEYAAALKLPYRTAMNHLRRFQELGMLEKTGSGRATEYKILRS